MTRNRRLPHALGGVGEFLTEITWMVFSRVPPVVQYVDGRKHALTGQCVTYCYGVTHSGWFYDAGYRKGMKDRGRRGPGNG